MRYTDSTASVLLIVALVAALAAAQPYSFCARNNPINSALVSCSAGNSNNLLNVAQLAGPRACVWGSTTAATVKLNLRFNTPVSLFDPALYVAVDGGAAQTGTCASATLGLYTRAGSTVLASDGGLSQQSEGPYEDFDLDACGEPRRPVWRTLPASSLMCVEDPTGASAGVAPNGVVDVGTCFTATTTRSAPPSCADPATALATTCACQRRDVDGLSVCIDDEPLCVGDSGLENASPCEPVFSARVTLTASPNAVHFVPGRVYRGYFYYDYSNGDERAALVHLDAATGAIRLTDVFWPCGRSRRTACPSTAATATYSGWPLPRFFRERTDVLGCADVPFFASRSALEAGGFECWTKLVPNELSSIKWIWASTLKPRVEIAAAMGADGSLWEFRHEDGGWGTHLGDVLSSVRTGPKLLPSLSSVVNLQTLGGAVVATSCPVATEVVLVALAQLNTDAKALLNGVVDSMSSLQSLFGVAWPTQLGDLVYTGLELETAAATQAALSAASPVAPSAVDYYAALAAAIEYYYPSAGPGVIPRRMVVLMGFAHLGASSHTASSVAALCRPRGIEVYIIERPSILPAVDLTTLGSHFPIGPANKLALHSFYMWKRICPFLGSPSVLGYCPMVRILHSFPFF